MYFEYNQDGCLPHGIHKLSLEEIEEEFVKGKSQRRQDIFENYRSHLKEIKDTNCCLNHWIDGSFVTLKENPNDIDTLTEFDGVIVEEKGMREIIDNIIYDAPLRTEGYCHSFVIYKFPEDRKRDYEEYLKYKSKILLILFPGIRNSNNLKGFVKLRC